MVAIENILAQSHHSGPGRLLAVGPGFRIRTPGLCGLRVVCGKRSPSGDLEGQTRVDGVTHGKALVDLQIHQGVVLADL